MVGRARIVCIVLALLPGFAARAQDAPAADSLAVAADSVALPRWPQLAGSDYVHFTLAGSRKIGDMFCDALFVYYDYYQWRKKNGR